MAQLANRPPLNFKKMFDGWVADTQKVWGHDRSKTLGGSEAFGCLRKAWYKRNGTPYDPEYEESWGALRRGDIIENHLVVPAMEWAAEHFKFELLMAGDNQITLHEEEYGLLSVTPDGLMAGLPKNALAHYGVPDLGTDCCMLEVKSIDPRVDLSEEKAIHHGQTQIQMGLMRENTAFKPNFAVLLYINASFLDDIEVFIVRFDEKKYQIAKDRAALVYKTTDPSKLYREGVIDNTCRYCPFQGSCLDTTQRAMPEVSGKGSDANPLLLAELNRVPEGSNQSLISRKRVAKKHLEKAEREVELINEEIKETLRRFNSSKAKDKDGGWSVSYSMAAGRKSLNKQALEEDGIDVEAYMRQGNPYEILRVSFTESDSDEL